MPSLKPVPTLQPPTSAQAATPRTSTQPSHPHPAPPRLHAPSAHLPPQPAERSIWDHHLPHPLQQLVLYRYQGRKQRDCDPQAGGAQEDVPEQAGEQRGGRAGGRAGGLGGSAMPGSLGACCWLPGEAGQAGRGA